MISVIVPIYNAIRFLERSLDAVLKSTFQDFELVLVDDGSTDGSSEICERYAQKHTNIQLVRHPQNAGLSAARNTGMKNAKGEYIIFMDSDDIVHPQLLQLLYDAISSGHYDFSMAWAHIVGEDAEFLSAACQEQIKNPPLKILNQADMMAGLWGSSSADFQYQATWNKLFKRELIEGLTFDDIATEDTEWQTRVFLRSSKGILVQKELYFWIQHQSSLSHSGVTMKYVDCMNTYKKCLDHLPSDSIYRSWCLEKLYKVIVRTKYFTRNTELANYSLNIEKNIYHTTIDEFKSSNIRWFKKYGLLLLYRFPWLYGLLTRVAEMMAHHKL